jgi:hypothetical protein
MPRSAHRNLAAVAAACALAAALGACGNSGPTSSASAKPSYCQQKEQLQSTVKELGGINPIESGTDAVKAQLEQVRSDAQKLVSAAKSDFPSEIGAIDSSLKNLEASIHSLKSAPNPQSAANVAADVTTFANALKSFSTAAIGKC